MNVFVAACINIGLVQHHRNQQFTGGKITPASLQDHRGQQFTGGKAAPVSLQDHRGQQFTGGESRSASLQDQGGQQFTGGGSRSASLQDRGGQQFMAGDQPISRWTLGKQTLLSSNPRLIRGDSIRWPLRLHIHDTSLQTSAAIQK